MPLFRFDNYCEAYAQAQPYIGHVPSKDGRQARFFRHQALDERMEIIKRISAFDKCDIFMSVITAFDGELMHSSENAPDPNFYVWRRHVLFWTHQNPGEMSVVPNDEESAADAKARGVEAATDFIAFMAQGADTHNKKHFIPALRGVDFDSIEIVTLPMTLDGWWITCLNFDQGEPRQKCFVDAVFDWTKFDEQIPFFTHDRFHH